MGRIGHGPLGTGRFRTASEWGSASAQARLGFLYYQGEGVPRDPVKALAWLQTARDRGDMDADDEIAVIAPTLSDQQRARAEELALSIRKRLEENL